MTATAAKPARSAAPATIDHLRLLDRWCRFPGRHVAARAGIGLPLPKGLGTATGPLRGVAGPIPSGTANWAEPVSMSASLSERSVKACAATALTHSPTCLGEARLPTRSSATAKLRAVW